MNLSDAKSIYINGKEIRSIMIDGRMVYEKVNMTLLASKEFIVSDESVSICLESDLQEKEVELFKVIGMTRESMGSKTTGSDGTASWSYTGTGAGLVGFVAVYDDKDSNTVPVDDYTPVVSSIGLVADKSAIISGQSVVLTASVVDQYEQAVSSGTVTFKVNGTSVGTGSISSGVATLTTSAFSDGVNQVTAEVGSVSSDIVNVSVVGLALTLGVTGSSFSSFISNPFTYTGGVVIDWGDGTIAEYTGGQLSHTYASSGNHEIKIGGDITAINRSAFYEGTEIVSVTIDSSITTLEKGCFTKCTGLTSITIPNSVTSIGGQCFFKCTSLTSITIPNSVTSIGDYCFNSCTGLTEIVLNWESASSIVAYNSNWIGQETPLDHFLIPQGTTSLYTAKGYPSALLQEAGQVEPDSIDLTGTKSILSYADREQSVLTATVYDENDAPIEGATVSIYKDNTLWYTDTTDSNGEITQTYNSAGVGDITFEARVAKGSSFVSKTYDIVDADWYNDCTTNSFETMFSSIPSSFSRSYSSNGVVISNSGNYGGMILSQTYSNPRIVEFELIDHTGSAPNFLLGQVGSVWKYCEYHNSKSQVDFCGATTSVSSTLGKWRFEIDTNEIRLYHENTLVATNTSSLSTLALQLAFSSNRSATIKDIIIKPL